MRPSAGQVEEAFRRTRGLLRADQLEAWLAHWAITAEDFRAWTSDVASGSSMATPWCALLCSGELDATTADVAAAAAAACALGHGPADAADFDPAGWTERLVAARTTQDALAAVLDQHRLGWTRLRTATLIDERRGVVEELRHQVLDDGASLSAFGAAETTAVLSGVAPELRSALLGARAGELVGPLRVAGSWTLVHVLSRTEPTLTDPESLDRATRAVRDDVIARAVARHVVA